MEFYRDSLMLVNSYEERERIQEQFKAELERRRNRPTFYRITESECSNWERFFDVFFYKPNFEMVFSPGNETHGNQVRFSMIVESSRGPGYGELVDVMSINPLSTWTTVENALQEVRRHIKAFENHEIDEWIQFNGHIPFDPHK